MNCEDVQCFVQHAQDVITQLQSDIRFWSAVNLAGEVFVAFCGIVSALVIALNDANARFWKAVGIAATILVTGTSTLLEETLHVRANTDKLIEIAGNIANATNKFERDAVGKTGTELQDLMKTYAEDRAAEDLRVGRKVEGVSAATSATRLGQLCSFTRSKRSPRATS